MKKKNIKKCKHCGSEFVQYNSLVKHCSKKCYYADNETKKKPIASISETQRARLFAYDKILRKYKSEHPNATCPVFPTKKATENHHKKGRVGNLLFDTKYFLLVSRDGHRWIHDHPDEARDRGWLISSTSTK